VRFSGQLLILSIKESTAAIKIRGISTITLFSIQLCNIELPLKLVFRRSLMTVISELLSTTYSTKSFLHSTAVPNQHPANLQHFNPGKLPIKLSSCRLISLCTAVVQYESASPSLRLFDFRSCSIPLIVSSSLSYIFIVAINKIYFEIFLARH